MEDLYIGQNDDFGAWVQEVIGGYRINTVPRVAGADAPTNEETYKTIQAATAAATAMLGA